MELTALAVLAAAVVTGVAVRWWVRRSLAGLRAPTFEEGRSALDLAARMQHRSRVRAELRGAGRAARARVLEVTETGERWALAPVLRLRLLLLDEGREVVVEEAVPMTVAPRLAAGGEARVHRDDADPPRVALDW